jgi:SOS response regulatory protein OraA/RecX
MIIGIILLIVLGGAYYYFYYMKPQQGVSKLLSLFGFKKPSTTSKKDLDTFVMSSLSEGHNSDSIKDTLRKKGWKDKQINSSLTSSVNKITNLHNISDKYGVNIPTKDLVNINRYIAETTKRGYTPAQIKTALIDSGWNKKQIDAVLEKNPKTKLKTEAKPAAPKTVREPNPKEKQKISSELKKGRTLGQIKKLFGKLKL